MTKAAKKKLLRSKQEFWAIIVQESGLMWHVYGVIGKCMIKNPPANSRAFLDRDDAYDHAVKMAFETNAKEIIIMREV